MFIKLTTVAILMFLSAFVWLSGGQITLLAMSWQYPIGDFGEVAKQKKIKLGWTAFVHRDGLRFSS
jgi:hypothetical protein